MENQTKKNMELEMGTGTIILRVLVILVIVANVMGLYDLYSFSTAHRILVVINLGFHITSMNLHPAYSDSLPTAL